MKDESKLNVKEDALKLAQAIYKNVVPDESWCIVNVIRGDTKRRHYTDFSVTLDGLIDVRIPSLYRYLYDDTLYLLEDAGVIERKIQNKWFITIAEDSTDKHLILDTQIDEFAHSAGYLRKRLHLYFYPSSFKWYTSKSQYSVIIKTDKLQEFISRQSEIQTRTVKTPVQREYWYEEGQLRFKMTDGSIDQLDFSKADISRKLFEAFWDLWLGDDSGEYAIDQILKSYSGRHKGQELPAYKISKIVSNIRSKILKPKTAIKNRIEWRFDRKIKRWIFRVR